MFSMSVVAWRVSTAALKGMKEMLWANEKGEGNSNKS